MKKGSQREKNDKEKNFGLMQTVYTIGGVQSESSKAEFLYYLIQIMWENTEIAGEKAPVILFYPKKIAQLDNKHRLAAGSS